MATDLDPLFVRALKLLNSKSKESAAQLKAMVDEAIAQRQGLKVPVHSGDAGKSSPSRAKGDEEYKRKDAEKRPHDKSTKDSSEPDIKKSKMDSKYKNKDEKDSRDKEREKEKAKREKDKKEKEEKEAQRQKEKLEKERKEKARQEMEVTMISDDEESPSQLDAGDFALEMGIACVVCKQFCASSGNQLVECQECHSLYHQECHKPPVAEETVNDPRFVWYCSRCQKMLQKKQQQVAQKSATKPTPKTTMSALSSKDTTSSVPLSTKSFKPETVMSNSTSQAFRKIDPKMIAPLKESQSQSMKQLTGLAGLAANLTKPQAKSSSAHRKTEHKTGADNSGTKLGRADGFNKSSSSKIEGSSSAMPPPSSKHKGDDRKTEKSSSSSSSDKDKKSDSSSKSNKEDKKSSNSEFSSKSFSSSSAFGHEKPDKKTSESTSKSEKKTSSSSSSNLKLDLTSAGSSSSKPSIVGASTPDTPDSPSSSSLKASGNSSTIASSNNTDKNKKAMANLSMITANKRMQMMMKKAQTKPTEKKVHIK